MNLSSSNLRMSGITKVINTKNIISDVTFEVPKGRIVGFLGPNGAGKTTTMHIAAGLSRPTTGEVWIGEILMNNNWKKAKEHISFIPDYPMLYDELTGEEYIRFTRDLFKLRVTERELAKEVVKFQLEADFKKRIKHYSLGNKKKLVLLASLLRQPSLLLLDEYISGLDPMNSILVRSILTEYAANNGSILLSTHQLEVAEKFCDEFILIQDGCIVDSTSLEEVLEHNSSLETYFVDQVQRARNISGKGGST
ncbi:ABC transporter [Paenibacillus marchantiophytorum]|uniref:ABC transporter n=1 Tax=Paenibacillus marchantiophytorum TaxID=1619310 RepID=A0ABQ1F9T8_9BACL|nr:ABC transporter ATP-binding protein [Paenibacillus marchantiophytorum]GGA03541.1 ABC transporter [Paenibacillus marchantiophytorum]